MTIVDVNILLYAHVEAFAQHPRAKQWFEELLAGPEVVALPWVVIWGFIRIATTPRYFSPGNYVAAVCEIAQDLIDRPSVRILHPGPNHLAIVEKLAIEGQSSGSRFTDAVLAALAIENGATLASADRDFARFPGLKWINPIAIS